MKLIKQLALMLAVGYCLTSCYIFQTLSGDNAGFYDNVMYSPLNDARQFVDTSKDQYLIVLPMLQKATAKHLASFKQYLDLKKAQGYIVYYETIDLSGNDENLTEKNIDTLLRKYRRVVGVNLDRTPKSSTKHIKDEDFRKDYNLTTWLDSLGLTTDRDHHVDMSLAQIVAYYEQNYKPITLTANDCTTPLDASRYSPSDTVAHAKYYMVWEPRVKHIIDQVVNSSDSKIIVVCSQDLMGYMLGPLLKKGYRSKYGYGALTDLRNNTTKE